MQTLLWCLVSFLLSFCPSVKPSDADTREEGMGYFLEILCSSQTYFNS